MPNKAEKLKQLLELLDKDSVAKMKQLVSLADDNTLTREEFVDQFKKILEYLNSFKTKNDRAFSSLDRAISQTSDRITSDQTAKLNEFKSLVDRLVKGLSYKIELADKDLKGVREEIVKSSKLTLSQAQKKILPLIPNIEAIGKDLPKIRGLIRNELEALKGSEKLKISAIKGLRKELDKLKKTRTILTGTSGGGTMGGHVQYKDLSASLDGSTRTFSLPAFARVLQVSLSSFPNILRETTDYTVDASAFTITFTSEISLNSISTGQTCWVLYATQ